MSTRVCDGYYHATPGRVRVRVSGIKERRDVARSLEVLLLSQPGISQVRANPVTGNVLVRFDCRAMSHTDVLKGLADLGHVPLIATSKREMDELDSKLCEIGLCVGAKLAKAALKQALRGSPASIILELL